MAATVSKVQKVNDKGVLSKMIDNEFISAHCFPYEIFPKTVQAIIKNAEETIGFNPDYLSTGILSNCAAAIGNTVTLFNGSYTSQPILWLAIIGRSGIGKTHPLKFAKKPIEEKDEQSYIEFQSLMEKYQRKKKKKGNKPNYVKSILEDFTPEKLAESLQHNDKGVLIFKDELIGWINSFDQYKKGGDQQKYLEFFNGGTLSVDRVSKPPIRVEKTCVNILGGMQPSLIKAMASNNRINDGFLARFLFVFPMNIKPNLFTGKAIDAIHVNNYRRLILGLYDAPETNLKASENQIEAYKNWQHKKVAECHNDDLETLIQSKLETYVWRLALIIEMMEQVATNKFKKGLSDASIYKAIKLIEYFRVNALRVYDKISSTNPLEDLPTNKVDLFKALPITFKRCDVIPLFLDHGIKGGTIARFLNKKDLFIRIDTKGNYKKKFN